MEAGHSKRWTCSLCGSDIVLTELDRRARRPGMRVRHPSELVPDHCSNPKCVYFDPRRVTFGAFLPLSS